MPRGRVSRPIEERLLDGIRLRGECWELLSGLDGSGRPQLWDNEIKKHRRASHVAWEMEHSFSPGSWHVCHTCDNPRCVNPEHLFLGSAQENMSDMVAKGRQAKGERGGNTKLTAKQVRQIRALCAMKSDQGKVAAEFGINIGTVSRIHRRVTWRHV